MSILFWNLIFYHMNSIALILHNLLLNFRLKTHILIQRRNIKRIKMLVWRQFSHHINLPVKHYPFIIITIWIPTKSHFESPPRLNAFTLDFTKISTSGSEKTGGSINGFTWFWIWIFTFVWFLMGFGYFWRKGREK